MTVFSTTFHGQTVLHTSRDDLLDVVSGLNEDGFDMVVDLTAVDYGTHPGRDDLPDEVLGERFELVVSLINHQRHERIRLRVQIPDSDPTVPSLFDIYPGTEAMEREVFDLFGFSFVGHPDQTRILMPEDWEGHPLRKDVSVGQIPVQFKSSSGQR
tara:strand:+ start:123 stop:590 length:468 start_codon:yes stop_codon:yes gene_type:complete